MTARITKSWRVLTAAIVSMPMVLGTSACKSGNAAQRLAKSTAPTLEGSTGKCKAGSEASKSLIVEWPMGDRAALETRIKNGLVAVRYRNCEMELITNCSVNGHYDYSAVTPKSDTIKITNADELYAKIPVGAVRLEGKLERSGQLNVEMTLVGRHEANKLYFQTEDLSGRCEGATHVVTGLSVGAFVFSSGAGADIGVSGSATGTGVQAGAGSTAATEILNRDGDAAACSAPPEGTDITTAPPPGCGAGLQVDVVPITRPEVSSSSNSVTGLTDTSDVAGENLETSKLDRRIKVSTITMLAGYGFAIAGGVVAFIGFRKNAAYGEESSSTSSTTPIGQAGSEERSKFVSGYTISQGLLYGGIGAFALGVTVGLVATIRRNKLSNERSTRLAGVGVSPTPDGVTVGMAWRF